MAELAEREAEMLAREAHTAAQHVRQLQLSERRFHGAFTHASIGMALLGLDGRVIQANDAFGRLVGLQAAELVGSEFAALLHPDDAQVFCAKLATAHGPAFEDFDLALRVRRGARDPVRLQVNCSFFRGPATPGAAQAGIPCLILQMLGQ
jgi:PAS domain S-box-containing protein